MFTKSVKKASELHEFLVNSCRFIGHKGGKMFELVSSYKPTGDQPQAIEYLSNRNKRGQEIPNVTWSYRLTEKLSLWQM